jgi:hypothetical protein
MIEKKEATKSVLRHCGCSVSGFSSFTTKDNGEMTATPDFDPASKIVTSVGLNSASGCLGKMSVDWS